MTADLLSHVTEDQTALVTETVAKPDAGGVTTLSRSATGWSAAMTLSSFMLNLLVTAVLARKLGASDFGLVAMVTTVTTFALAFGDAGLSTSTIQNSSLRRRQVDTLFWINGGVGFVLWGVCSLAAPFVASFYGREELVPLIIMMGASLAISGFAVQPLALLQRQMMLKSVAIARVGAAGLGAVVAVTLAFSKAGYWALAWQQVTSQAALLALTFLLSGYRPSRPCRDPSVLPLLRFGGWVTFSGFFLALGFVADDIAIGRVWGATELGYYTRAFLLASLATTLVNSTMHSVMVPALSAVQHDADKFQHTYYGGLRTTAFISVPIAVGLALVAPEAVRLYYGEEWQRVVPILIWLSVVGAVKPIFETQRWLLLAGGKARISSYLSCLYASAMTATFLVTVNAGTEALAMSYAMVFAGLIAGPIFYMSHQAVQVPVSGSVRVLMPVFVATFVMIVLVIALTMAMNAADVEWMVALVAKVSAGTLAYFVVILLIDRGPSPHLQACIYRFRRIRGAATRGIVQEMKR